MSNVPTSTPHPPTRPLQACIHPLATGDPTMPLQQNIVHHPAPVLGSPATAPRPPQQAKRGRDDVDDAEPSSKRPRTVPPAQHPRATRPNHDMAAEAVRSSIDARFARLEQGRVTFGDRGHPQVDPDLRHTGFDYLPWNGSVPQVYPPSAATEADHSCRHDVLEPLVIPPNGPGLSISTTLLTHPHPAQSAYVEMMPGWMCMRPGEQPIAPQEGPVMLYPPAPPTVGPQRPVGPPPSAVNVYDQVRTRLNTFDKQVEQARGASRWIPSLPHQPQAQGPSIVQGQGPHVVLSPPRVHEPVAHAVPHQGPASVPTPQRAPVHAATNSAPPVVRPAPRLPVQQLGPSQLPSTSRPAPATPRATVVSAPNDQAALSMPGLLPPPGSLASSLLQAPSPQAQLVPVQVPPCTAMVPSAPAHPPANPAQHFAATAPPPPSSTTAPNPGGSMAPFTTTGPQLPTPSRPAPPAQPLTAADVAQRVERARKELVLIAVGQEKVKKALDQPVDAEKHSRLVKQLQYLARARTVREGVLRAAHAAAQRQQQQQQQPPAQAQAQVYPAQQALLQPQVQAQAQPQRPCHQQPARAQPQPDQQPQSVQSHMPHLPQAHPVQHVPQPQLRQSLQQQPLPHQPHPQPRHPQSQQLLPHQLQPQPQQPQHHPQPHAPPLPTSAYAAPHQQQQQQQRLRQQQQQRQQQSQQQSQQQQQPQPQPQPQSQSQPLAQARAQPPSAAPGPRPSVAAPSPSPAPSAPTDPFWRLREYIGPNGRLLRDPRLGDSAIVRCYTVREIKYLLDAAEVVKGNGDKESVSTEDEASADGQLVDRLTNWVNGKSEVDKGAAQRKRQREDEHRRRREQEQHEARLQHYAQQQLYALQQQQAQQQHYAQQRQQQRDAQQQEHDAQQQQQRQATRAYSILDPVRVEIAPAQPRRHSHASASARSRRPSPYPAAGTSRSGVAVGSRALRPSPGARSGVSDDSPLHDTPRGLPSGPSPSIRPSPHPRHQLVQYTDMEAGVWHPELMGRIPEPLTSSSSLGLTGLTPGASQTAGPAPVTAPTATEGPAAAGSAQPVTAAAVTQADPASGLPGGVQGGGIGGDLALGEYAALDEYVTLQGYVAQEEPAGPTEDAASSRGLEGAGAGEQAVAGSPGFDLGDYGSLFGGDEADEVADNAAVEASADTGVAEATAGTGAVEATSNAGGAEASVQPVDAFTQFLDGSVPSQADGANFADWLNHLIGG